MSISGARAGTSKLSVRHDKGSGWAWYKRIHHDSSTHLCGCFGRRWCLVWATREWWQVIQLQLRTQLLHSARGASGGLRAERQQARRWATPRQQQGTVQQLWQGVLQRHEARKLLGSRSGSTKHSKWRSASRTLLLKKPERLTKPGQLTQTTIFPILKAVDHDG